MTIAGRLTLASLVLAGLGLAAPAAGAGQESAIAGTVTDETGGVLPGVTVEARDPAAGGAPRIAVTDGAGRFSFTALEPGAYDLTAILPGFVTAVRAGVEPGAEVAIELQAQFEETVVVVGTRAAPRSATASPVPIDAIPYQDVVSQGASDLSDQLRNVVPSYHVNTQPISDAATIVRPVNLRGLAPDHTLVLVNGRRRHRSAVINWLGNGAADGAQGPDVSVIPAIALRQVEVLRDGASAQYGSDAIAGVLNFQLKDDPSGASFEFRTGAHGAGDGESWSVAGNAGLPLGATGFANLSLEYGNTGPTSRSVQRDDAQALIDAGNTAVADPVQIWGSPEIDDDLKLFGNFGHLFDNGLQLYGHANYASKTVTGGFYFRNPNTRWGIYSADMGETLLIGDALDARDGVLDGSAACPTVAITGHRPDPAALRAVFDDPDCFSFQELLPGGFTPRFGGDSNDASIVAGLRGLGANGLVWDASASVGAHEVDLFITDTVNASLGPQTPLAFRPGLNRQREVNLNFDVSHPVTGRVNVAAGGEWRQERFTTGLGDRESWVTGPYGAQGFASTSNGFPGYGPLTAGVWSRANVAVYGDLEVRGAEDAWTAGAALRVERFDDFGLTTNGKVSARYQVARALALRGSASTGFRAPTPGQANVFNTSVEFDQETNDSVFNVTLPPTWTVAGLYGGLALQPERSVNVTAGAVVESGPFTLTADYFHIDLRDRIGLSQNFRFTAREVDVLLAEGVESARDLRHFRFFTNAFDTRTQGIDLVATWTPPALGGGTSLSAIVNRTVTRVTDFDPGALDDIRIRELQEAVPRTRWNAAVTQAAGPVRLRGRLHFYGGWWDTEDFLRYRGKHLLDLELDVPLRGGTTLAVGGQNVLNTYPDEHPFARQRLGNRYSQFTPFGFNGGYYYVRITHAWRSGA